MGDFLRGSDSAVDAITAMLTERGAGKTLCPSEVARVLAGADGDWRARMMDVHAATDDLVECGAIAISWQRERLARRDGPYRIGCPQ